MASSTKSQKLWANFKTDFCSGPHLVGQNQMTNAYQAGGYHSAGKAINKPASPCQPKAATTADQDWLCSRQATNKATPQQRKPRIHGSFSVTTKSSSTRLACPIAPPPTTIVATTLQEAMATTTLTTTATVTTTTTFPEPTEIDFPSTNKWWTMATMQ
jgi:hypothetical protein